MKNIENNVISFVKKNAEDNPKKIAFIYSENEKFKEMSNEVFFDKVLRFANILEKEKIKKNDRIIIFLPISVELYIILAGLQIIGAIPVFLESWSEIKHIKTSIKNAEPNGIISLSKLFDKYGFFFRNFDFQMSIDSISKKKKVLSFNEEIEHMDGKKEIQGVEEDDTALITYTTGSSGLPKGADRTHKFLKSQHYALNSIFPYKEDDIDMPIFPVFALNNLAGGVTMVIPEIMSSDNLSDGDIKKLVNQIQQLNINNLTLSPIIFNKLTKFAQKNNLIFTEIKRVLTGGAPVSENDVFQFKKIVPNAEVWILYGSTEVEPISHIEAKDMIEIMKNLKFDSKNKTSQGVVVGKIHEDLDFAFIKTDFKDWKVDNIEQISVLENEIGELVVSGKHVCERYYKNEDAFQRAKIQEKKGKIWHRTGDIARLDKQNNLWIVGRKHNLIKKNDVLFFPVRPEILLKEILGAESVAYLEAEKKGKKEIFAVIEGVEDEKKVKKIIEKFKKEKIPLDNIIFMDRIIMDIRHHSKVNYSAMRKKIQKDTKINRWKQFLKERFCILKILPMTLVFSLAHQKIVDGSVSFRLEILFLIIITTLFFLKLRLFDEIKDYKTDLKIHPRRPLPRKLLKKNDLFMAVILISILEFIFFSFYGLWFFGFLTIGFSWLMYKEFFVSKWIRNKITFYALSHTFVVSLFSLAIFSLFTRDFWNKNILLFVMSAWLIFSFFEFGRKTFLKKEEVKGVNTYSKQFGLRGALFLSWISSFFGLVFLLIIKNEFLFSAAVLFLILVFLSLTIKKNIKWFRFYTMFIIFLIYFLITVT